MLAAALKGTLLGLVAGVAIAVALGKFGLLRREGKLRNVLAKLWCVYIPLVVTLSCAAWLGVAQSRAAAGDLMNQIRPGVTEFSVEFAEGVIEYFHLEAVSGDLEVGVLMSVMGGYIDGQFEASLLPRVEKYSSYAGKLVNYARPYISRALSDYIETSVLKAAAGSLNISEERLIEVWNADIVTALRSGLLMDIIHAQIERYFASALRIVKIISLLLAMPPLLEIAMARRSRRKAAG
ncbi:MAG: hypothetical protein LBU26_06780 [Synergistaceae bacterium]|jgi:hypothetical protein|nr:hypothetical protein [Synergistaceae bacterium]